MENEKTPDKRYPIVFVRCRRGTDPSTYGQECKGNRAYNMSDPGGTMVRFQCVDCGHIWVTPVGGAMRLPDGC